MKKTLNASESRQVLAEATSLHWFHWGILLLSAVLTFFAWSYAKDLLSQKMEAKYEREAETVIQLLTERIALYENALRNSSALMVLNNGHISHQAWHLFAKELDIDKAYPGINGIGIIFNIKEDNLESYLTKQRLYRPDFSIFPEHTQGEYWPITYIEPEQPNRGAIGLDVAFESNRYEAILKSRDTGTAQITGPIVLVQDDKKTPGFLLYEPFYTMGANLNDVSQRRKNIVGMTYAPFIMSQLMDGALAKQRRHVELVIKDGNTLLYSDEGGARDPKPLFSKDKVVEMYGRTWTINIESDLSFRTAVDSDQPTIILVGGVIIDLLLLFLFLFLSKANRKALNYADDVTKELLIQAEHLEKSNKDLQEFSYVASHDLKSPLNAIKQLASWVKDDCDDILPEESKKHLILLQSRADRMLKLLSDLLSYSRLSEASYEYKIVNLEMMVKDCFEVDVNSGSFTYSVSSVEIDVPFIPFEIVMRNLISNSIKHHDRLKGEITVSYQKGHESHVLEVRDDGPGIPKELHKKAMEMFQTLKSRDKLEGSGMGLAIVKKIVEQHGGTIMIKAVEGRGTTFMITWPFKPH